MGAPGKDGGRMSRELIFSLLPLINLASINYEEAPNRTLRIYLDVLEGERPLSLDL